MSKTAGLGRFPLVAFVSIRDAGRAKHFYRDVLGLELVSEDGPFALVFEVQGVMLRLAINPDATPIPGTVLGWRVPDIQTAVEDLVNAGATLERYPFLQQDELGIWNSPGGARVAWFKDPDGNVLSLSQHPE
ncbi:VOC family protein [Acidobacteria bacterium AB60]|nr:VOC family protein [Acidobacteria bacterium AB60]